MKLNSVVTYKVDNPLTVVIRKHILCRPKVKIRINHHDCNPNSCAWPKPPQVRDIGVLRVWAHDLEHHLLGLRPSGNTLVCTLHRMENCHNSQLEFPSTTNWTIV
jgi:hypothetical protein